MRFKIIVTVLLLVLAVSIVYLTFVKEWGLDIIIGGVGGI